MEENLRQLHGKYEKSIEVQKKVIDNYNIKLKKAREELNFKEVKRLHTLLKILYEEKSELELTAYSINKYLS